MRRVERVGGWMDGSLGSERVGKRGRSRTGIVLVLHGRVKYFMFRLSAAHDGKEPP